MQNFTIHSHNTVWRWIDCFFLTGSIECNLPPGRAPVVSEEDEFAIVALALDDGFFPVSQYSHILGIDCSKSTIKRILHKNGIHNFRARRRELFTAAHAQSRFQWAQLMSGLLEKEDYRNTIFIDEVNVSSEYCGPKNIWRPYGTPHELRYIN